MLSPSNRYLWWVDIGWLPNPHPPALLLTLLNRTEGGNKDESQNGRAWKGLLWVT